MASPGWRALAVDRTHPRYKWVALSNTTLGVLMATINSSIVIISLPAIFRGIRLDPLDPANVGYLLWTLMGFLVITAVLVVTLGRLGDMYGRVRIYNAGFIVFTVASIVLALDPLQGGSGALWLILWRLVQGIGAAMCLPRVQPAPYSRRRPHTRTASGERPQHAHRPLVLPDADQPALPPRSGHRVHRGDRDVAHRRGGVTAPGHPLHPRRGAGFDGCGAPPAQISSSTGGSTRG
jgi:hypothetical protein